MDWQELPNAKAARIALRKDLTDIKNEKERLEAYQWHKEKGEKIMRVTKQYIYLIHKQTTELTNNAITMREILC